MFVIQKGGIKTESSRRKCPVLNCWHFHHFPFFCSLQYMTWLTFVLSYIFPLLDTSDVTDPSFSFLIIHLQVQSEKTIQRLRQLGGTDSLQVGIFQYIGRSGEQMVIKQMEKWKGENQEHSLEKCLE